MTICGKTLVAYHGYSSWVYLFHIYGNGGSDTFVGGLYGFPAGQPRLYGGPGSDYYENPGIAVDNYGSGSWSEADYFSVTTESSDADGGYGNDHFCTNSYIPSRIHGGSGTDRINSSYIWHYTSATQSIEGLTLPGTCTSVWNRLDGVRASFGLGDYYE